MSLNPLYHVIVTTVVSNIFPIFTATVKQRVCWLQNGKMTEKTVNVYKNLENEMIDLVRCYITSLSFTWNPILWAVHKKFFPWNGREICITSHRIAPSLLTTSHKNEFIFANFPTFQSKPTQKVERVTWKIFKIYWKSEVQWTSQISKASDPRFPLTKRTRKKE